MELANRILLVIHLLGVGALLSGFFYQLKDLTKGQKVNAGIIHGAWLMLITGFGMIGMVQAIGTEQVNNIVIGLKAIALTAIFFIAYTYNKKEKTPVWVVPTIAGLTTLNIVFAVVVGVIQSK